MPAPDSFYSRESGLIRGASLVAASAEGDNDEIAAALKRTATPLSCFVLMATVGIHFGLNPQAEQIVPDRSGRTSDEAECCGPHYDGEPNYQGEQQRKFLEVEEKFHV